MMGDLPTCRFTLQNKRILAKWIALTDFAKH